ncbi:alanine/ornithine racemase family PLP-dependent enzyme [Halanaerobacter jeridensis]|uniref:Amino acid racemase n=1 Tax=Halanaerobacter jeridensis TaxID=706427 RepID=A0A938XUK8_9FIRM|nr:alanine/ornithine racemase family PLP-dependent enzyme [Halanaerobacter jeridensis]MBM7557800.1 putative amino acid racemase [Halanaerobacter jeridensis]
MYPKVEINLAKIKDNAQRIVSLTKRNGINVWGVTKGVKGDPEVAKKMLEAGVRGLADSRIENLKRLSDLDTELMLLRSPMLSQVEQVIDYADISLNSELEVIKQLNQAAVKKEQIHKIILMVDLGDRREGVLPNNVLQIVKKIETLSNIKLVGLGTNLACFMGILPSKDKMKELIRLKDEVEKELNITLDMISGGNSSSLPLLLDDNYQAQINQLRIGETILLGREVPSGNAFPGTITNTVKLKAEIIELRQKPTSTKGQQGENAFGEKKEIIDKGVRQRAILAVGKQDIDPTGLIPSQDGIIIEGASSDHLIVDVTERENVVVGSILEFELNYPCLLRALTSPYVDVEYFNNNG